MSSNKTFLHAPASDFKAYAMMKTFPDGSRKIIAASKPIFGGEGWELSDKWDSEPRKRVRKDEPSTADLMRSKRRAAAALRDYALCNDFKWFVTLTLSAEKINRYSLEDAVKKLRVWLDNRVRRKGLKYILVPEQHKDGAYHFHGFVNDAVDAVDSGTLKIDGCGSPRKPRGEKQRQQWVDSGAKIVYNLLEWDLGFSTAIEIYGDYHKAISYVSKYVTKQGQKLGGRWYFSGGNLRKPVCDTLSDVTFDDICAAEKSYVFPVPNAGISLAILEVCGATDG